MPASAIPSWLRAPIASAAGLYPILILFFATSFLGRNVGPGLSDEKSYLHYADRLVHGHYANRQGGSGAFLWHGPGLPLLVSPLVAIGTSPTIIRLVGPIALFVGVVGMRRLLRRFMAERYALVGAYVFALYWPFYTVLPRLYSEPLAVALLIWFMDALVESLGGRRGRPAILAGVLFGLLALTRVEFGWIAVLGIAGSLVWFAVTRTAASRQLLRVSVIALAMCIPWLAYTYDVSGQAMYWGNSSGLSLYWTASPLAGNLGDWRSERQVFTDPRLKPHRPFFSTLSHDPVTRDLQLRRLAVRWIEHHPANYARNVVANATRQIFNTPYSFTSERLSSLFYAVPNSFLLAAAAVLLPLALRLRGRWPAPEDVVLALLGLAIFAEHALIAAYARFFILVVPILFFFFWRAAASVWDAVGRRSSASALRAGAKN